MRLLNLIKFRTLYSANDETYKQKEKKRKENEYNQRKIYVQRIRLVFVMPVTYNLNINKSVCLTHNHTIHMA